MFNIDRRFIKRVYDNFIVFGIYKEDNMIKVVYFDDNSATDYLNIYNGGYEIQTKDKIKEKSAQLANTTSVGVFAKLNWLPFFGGKAESSINTNFSFDGSSLVKTTLSNTVLTDFLKKSKGDDRIIKFKGFSLRAYKNSIAFFKMFTPYLKITKSDFTSEDGFVFDISKMDDAFKSGKGYYELIAEKIENDVERKHVLRFNIEAFRNNYGIADLSKMSLKYLAIKVGCVNELMLDISKEFNVEKDTISSAFDIIDKTKKVDELEVYDVILAGIDI